MNREKGGNDIGGILKDAAFGLIAGAAATFVMDKMSGYLYELEDEETRKYEENLRGNEYPPEALAEEVSVAVTGEELDKESRQKYGNYIHWGFGIMGGGLFDRLPLVGVADGVGFGAGLWLIGDEVMMPLMGLSPPSTESPWQNHARAFANHFAYGATLGITRSLLRKLSE